MASSKIASFKEKIQPHKCADSVCSEKEGKAQGFAAATSHLMEEGSASEHHRELAGVVGVVEPGLVGDVPGVVAAREADDAVPRLPPDTANTKAFGETQTQPRRTGFTLDTDGAASKVGLQVMEMPTHEKVGQLLIQRMAKIPWSLGKKDKCC